ncbi:MAG: AAA family ATPase [Spirulina sp.]
MSSLATEFTSDHAPDRFPSFAALRLAYTELLKRHRQEGENLELLSDIKTFICQGRETGAVIDNDDDRLAAQSLLDYWVSVLLRAGYPVIDSDLANFDIELSPSLDDSDCPYLGLEAFKEKDAHRFYGRQRLVTQLVDALGTSPLLAVVGASGSGKSSVVRGGLLPKLKAEALPNSHQWYYFPPLVPGSNPLENLMRTLTPNQQHNADQISQNIRLIEKNPTTVSDLIRQIAGEQSAVIVIDQFEETFTLCQDKQLRIAFINSLVALIQSSSSVQDYLILTMRSDFEDQISTLSELPAPTSTFGERFRNSQVRVLPLDAGELREAISAPAEQVGLKFEEGVVDHLITDVLGEPAALPLLQFVLLQLWKHRERNRVTYSAYQDLGGARHALAQSADDFYDHLIPQDQDVVKRIVLKMVRPSAGLEVTSNRIRKQDLDQLGLDPSRIDHVLEKLSRANLVRLTPGETPQDTQIEVAHEALIRNWPRLIEWLDEERGHLRQRLRLVDTAQEWERRGYPRDMLLKGIVLDEARQYEDLSPVERNLIHRSIRARKIKTLWRVGFLSTAIIALSALSILLAIRNTELEDAVDRANAAFNAAEKARSTAEQERDDARRLNQELIAAQETITRQEESLNTVTDGASQLERQGFDALLLGDLKQARDYFRQAENAFPGYHNVYEIYNNVLTVSRLEEYDQSSPERQGEIMRDIYQDILKTYSWGAPQDVLAQMEARLNATVEYYPRENETSSVIPNRLNSLGFSVVTMPLSTNPVPLNALWFGDGVDLGTVRLITQILINEGAPLQSIQPFQEDSPNRVTNKLKISGDGDALNCPLWTTEAVQSATVFTRANHGCQL